MTMFGSSSFSSVGRPHPVACALRHIVRIGEGARLGIVEHHVALPGEAAFANSVMQIELERGASLRHYRVIDGSPDAANAITTFVDADEEAQYEAFALIVGGGFNRVETTVELEGARAVCRIGGAYAVGGDDVCDNTTLVAHRAPKTTSRQVFRGVIDDHAHAVFQGRVIVDRAAQEADGHQLSKALLLSETAEIDQKPALEIFADNVKCSHGAAAGQLDPTAMFYLRSRGLSEAIARQMLLEGFLAEVLLEISDEEVRRQLSERIVAAVRRKGKGEGMSVALRIAAADRADKSSGLRCRRGSQRVSDPVAKPYTAVRSCIWTAPHRRKSRAAC